MWNFVIGGSKRIFFNYHDSSLGLATKARACKGASQKENPGVTFCAPKIVGKCEEMNSHTPKWAPKSLKRYFRGQISLD
jgi:hypothetical protein